MIQRESRRASSRANLLPLVNQMIRRLALEMYAKKMQRSRDTGVRIDALLRGEEPSLGDGSSVGCELGGG